MLKYIAKSGYLVSKIHGILKTVNCPLQKSWEDLQRIESDTDRKLEYLDGLDGLDGLGGLGGFEGRGEEIRTTERHRYCDCCRLKVMNLNGLTEGEIAGACLANPDLCLHATLPHPAIEVEGGGERARNCPFTSTELRVIHTARHLVAMNNAVEKGFWPLIKPVIPDKTIGTKLIVWQDEFGIVYTSTDYRSRGARGDTYWHNPYISPLPFAAYLIPPDIEVGERVYLVDLIEDRPCMVWNQGDSWRAGSAEAIWTGEEFELDESAPLRFLG